MGVLVCAIEAAFFHGFFQIWHGGVLWVNEDTYCFGDAALIVPSVIGSKVAVQGYTCAYMLVYTITS